MSEDSLEELSKSYGYQGNRCNEKILEQYGPRLQEKVWTCYAGIISVMFYIYDTDFHFFRKSSLLKQEHVLILNSLPFCVFYYLLLMVKVVIMAINKALYTYSHGR